MRGDGRGVCSVCGCAWCLLSHAFYTYFQGVSFIRRVFQQLLGGIFKFLFSLDFLSNYGQNFENVAVGCFLSKAGFYQPLRNL